MAEMTRSRSSGQGRGRAALRRVLLVILAVLLLGQAAAGAAAAPATSAPSTSGASGAPSDPDAVKLKADRALHFDAGAKLLTAEGHVHLAYRNITLDADALQVDLDRDLVRAEGHVRFRKGKDRIEADSAVYDLDKEAGTFREVTTTYRGEDLKGDVIVVGSSMESGKSLLRLANSSLTTCDLPQPHYHFEAKEIMVYLDDRVEARQVSYFEGRVRLFTLPYLVIPLKKENQFELPRFGYSQTDGWFVKTTYNYYRSAAAFGAYFLDWYQRKGLGVGLKHNYAFGQKPSDGAGWGYLYLKGNREQNDEEVFLGVDHRQQFGPDWKAVWRGSYEDRYLSPTQKQETAGTVLQVTEQKPAALTDLSASYRVQVTETLPSADGGSGAQTDLRDVRLAFNTAQKLRDDWDWRFGASATRFFQVGRTPYDNLGYQTQVARAFPDFTFRLSAQQQFNPPQVAEGETPPPWNRYTRFPDLTLETRTLTYQGRPLPLNFSASVSRYEEFSLYHPEGYALTLGSLTGRLTGLSYPLADRVTANLNATGTATYYQNGDYTLGAATGAGLTYRPLPPLTASLRYTWQDRLGANPFTSTGIAPAQNVAGSLSYLAGGVTVDVSTGYNLLSGSFQDVVGRLSVARPRLSASALVSYDPNTDTWRRASLVYAYQVSETQLLKLGAAMDLGASRLERLDVQAAQPLTRLWRGEITLSYDGFADQLSRGEVALTRDWHCREVRFRYDEVRREIWAELRIKALPTQVLRLGAGEEKLMFDTQALGGLLSPDVTTPGVPR